MKKLIALAAVTLLTGCATQTTGYVADPPGFLHGVLHGALALPSLIGSFFWDIRIYAVPNGGRWYDAGFVLGVGIFFSALGHQSFEQPYALGYQDGFEAARKKLQNSN